MSKCEGLLGSRRLTLTGKSLGSEGAGFWHVALYLPSPFSFLHSQDGGSIYLRNVNKRLPYDTVTPKMTMIFIVSAVSVLYMAECDEQGM
jgi:hypothetical protein